MAEVEEFVWGTKLSIQYAPTALSVYVGPKQIILKIFFLSLFQPMGCKIPLILIWSPLMRGSLTFGGTP